MATDLATLALKVENGDVVKATTSLNSMEVAGTKAEASATRLTRRMALLEIQAREMDAQMAKSATTVGRLRTTMENVEKVVPGLTGALGALSAAAAIGFIGHKTIEETEQAQAAMAQLEAAVKATGGAAGRSVQQLDELSIALQKQTTYSDEAVKGAEAILLTFNKIRADQFDRATVAVADLATRMGRDLPDAALQVGKALQDPVEGLQALQRLGVRFSASQKDVIRDLVDTGRAAEAQQIILDKLQGTFSGSAAAARDTLGGALKALSNAWGDLFEVSSHASQGTVDGINAITKSLEDSGLSMNQFVLNTVVGWEKIKAAAQEANEIMRLQIGPGFFARAQAISQRIQFDLSTKIAALNAPAKTGPTGAATAPPGGTDDVSDAAKKFAALIAQQDAEIGKLAALNAAYRESHVTLALLGIQYDAQIKKSENTQGHTAREVAILNARTDALTRQKVAQVLLNDQLERERKLQEARDQNTGTIEAALHARDRADLSAPDAEIQAIRDRATEEEAAARRAHDQKQGLRAEEQATEDAMFRERIANIHATTDAEIEGIRRARQAALDQSIGFSVRDTEQQTAGLRAMIAAELEGGKAAEQMRVQLAGNDAVQRALNDAAATGATVTDEQAAALRRTAEEYERTSIAAEKLRAVQQEVSAAVNQFFTDVFNRKNPGPALAQQIKGAIIAAVSQPITAKITATVAHVLGLEEQLSKQEKAAKDMNTAADKMLRAAQIYTGHTPPDAPTPDPGTSSPRADAIRKYFGQIAGVAGAGLGGYGVGYGVGQATGSGVLGAASGAITGAKLGAAFGPAGMAVGALAGFAGGIIGAGDAAREAAARLEAARRSFTNSWNAIIAEINGDDLAKAIAGADDRFQQLAQQYADTLTVTDILHGKLASGLADINAKEAEYIANLKVEAAAKARSQIESYRERELRAEGRNAEADALHAKEERQQLIDSFGKEIDATERQILAAYDAAAAAEKNTAAINSLTTSVRNAPSGFKLEGYIQQYAKGSPLPGQWQVPTNPFVPPASPLAPPPTLSRTGASSVTAPASLSFRDIIVNVPKTNAQAGDIAKAVVRELDSYAAAMGGSINSTRVDALKRYPST